MLTGALNALLDWVSANPTWAGLAVFGIACFESLLIIGYLVPGIFVLFGIGALIGSGYLSFWPIAIWAACGAVVGDVVSYLVGYVYRDRLRLVWPFGRHPELFGKGELFFERHGGKSVAFGRFVGPVRPLIPAIAGMTGMGLARFLIIDIISAALWAPVYLFPGMVFGASLELAAAVATRLMLLIAIAAVCLWLVYQLLKRLARHIREPFRRAPDALLIGAIVAGFAAIAVLTLYWTPLGDALLPGTASPPRRIAAADWWHGGWRRVGELHANRHGDAPLNLQVTGEPAALAATLAARGWRRPPPLTLDHALHWLAPDPAIADLPLLPQLRSRRGEKLVLVRPSEDGLSEWVLKLWDSGWQATDGRPISVGRVSRYRLDRRLPLLSLPRPNRTDNAGAVLARLRAALKTPAAKLADRRAPAHVLLILYGAPLPPVSAASAAARVD